MDMVKRSRWMWWRTQFLLLLARRSPGSVCLLANPAFHHFETEKNWRENFHTNGWSPPLDGFLVCQSDDSIEKHPLNCDPTTLMVDPLPRLSWTLKGFLFKKKFPRFVFSGMGCGASTGHYSELAYEKFKHDAEDEGFFWSCLELGLGGVIIATTGVMKWLGNFRLSE